MKKILRKLKKKIFPVLAFKARKGIAPIMLLGLAILILAGGIGGYALATKQTYLSGLTSIVAGIIEGISMLMVSIFSIFITAIIQVIIGVAQFNAFTTMPAIIKGWEIIRDICNMFFVIVFLVMAFGTIIKKENYSYKKLLLPLILMAVFVNFSLTLCGLVIDFAQVIMLTFVNAFKDVGAGNLLDMLGVRDLIKITPAVQTSVTSGAEVIGTKGLGGLERAGVYAMAAILSFIAFIVLAVVAIILILRIVALWFLVVLSPIAFVFYVIPGTQQYAKQWQTKFFNQIIVGPVMAFFLWLSFYVVEQANSDPNLKSALESAAPAGSLVPVINHPSLYAGFILGCGMLIGSLMAAKQLGVVGASLAGKGMDFIQKSGKSIASRAAKIVAAPAKIGARAAGGWAYRRVLESPFQVFTPNFWKGYRQRGERLREQAKQSAGGGGEQLAENVAQWRPWKGGKSVTPKADLAEESIINQIRADLEKQIGQGKDSKERMIELAKRAFHKGGVEGDRERRAILEIATAKGNFDDVHEAFITDGLVNEKNMDRFGITGKDDAEKKANLAKFNATANSPQNYKKFMMGFLDVNKGFDPESHYQDILEKQGGNYQDILEKQGEKRSWEEVLASADTSAEGKSSEEVKQIENDQELVQRVRAEGKEKRSWEEVLASADTSAEGKSSEEVKQIENDQKLVQRVRAEGRKRANGKIEKSSSKDQARLRAMFGVAQQSRRVGHWEQIWATLNHKNGKYEVMDEEDSIAEVSSEAIKTGMQQFLPWVVPHNMAGARMKNGKKYASPDYMERWHRLFMKEVMRPDYVPEFRRLQGRVAEQALGLGRADNEGKFAMGVRVDRKTGKALPGQMDIIKKHREAISPEVFDAMYRLAITGDPKADLDVMKSLEDGHEAALAEAKARKKGGGKKDEKRKEERDGEEDEGGDETPPSGGAGPAAGAPPGAGTPPTPPPGGPPGGTPRAGGDTSGTPPAAPSEEGPVQKIAKEHEELVQRKTKTEEELTASRKKKEEIDAQQKGVTSLKSDAETQEQYEKRTKAMEENSQNLARQIAQLEGTLQEIDGEEQELSVRMFTQVSAAANETPDEIQSIENLAANGADLKLGDFQNLERLISQLVDAFGPQGGKIMKNLMGGNLESLAENIKKLQSGFQGQRDTYLTSGLKDKKLDFLEIYALAKQLSIELNKRLKIQGGSGDTNMETK